MNRLAGSSSRRASASSSTRGRSWTTFVDESGHIVASVLSVGEADDATVAIELIKETDAALDRFTADGAYDRRSVYQAVAEAGVPGVELVIPPRCRAVPSDFSADTGSNSATWSQRDQALETIAEVGRQGWQRESGYRKRRAS